MPKKKKTVAIVFAGGTTLVADTKVYEVRSERDIQRWLQQVPELALIADIRPVFVAASLTEHNAPQAWVDFARRMKAQEKYVDGFVLTQPFAHIPYTAAALTLYMQHTGKPVVITGSPDDTRTLPKKASQLTEERGIRSHLVNAVHAATLDIAEVMVLFGNHILRGGSVVYQSQPNATVLHGAQPHIGRLDFGLKLDASRQHRSRGNMRFRGAFTARVLSLTPIPGHGLVPPDLTNTDGVLILGHTGVSPDAFAPLLDAANKTGIPVALYTHTSFAKQKNVIVIRRVTPAMAYVKFMWALSQTSSLSAVQRLVNKDVSGEILQTTQRLP